MDPRPLEALLIPSAGFFLYHLIRQSPRDVFEMQGPCWEGGFKEDLQEGPWAKSRRYASIWWWGKVDVQKGGAK